MMYPALVFGFAVVVLVAIVAFVIPIFAGIFEELAEENPERKRRAAAADPDLRRRLRTCSPATGTSSSRRSSSVVVGFFKWKKTERGTTTWDRFKLRMPFKIGDVIQKVALARWSRTFSGSVSSGVPMLQAIKLTGETSGNVVVEQAMEDVYASVKRGGTLAGPIEAQPDLPADGRPHGRGRRGDRPARAHADARSPTSTRPRSTPR